MIDKVFALSSYPQYARMVWWKTISKRHLVIQGVQLGEGVQILGCPIVSMVSESEIIVDTRIHIGSDSGISGVTFCAAVEMEIGD